MVVQVTKSNVVYDIRVYTPGLGWDGGRVSATLAEWHQKHPQHQPQVGLKFSK